MAVARGVPPAQLALSWLKLQSKKPGVTVFVPISGKRSNARVEENAATFPCQRTACRLLLSSWTAPPATVIVRYPDGGDETCAILRFGGKACRMMRS